jgi:hypothetical protein
VGLEQDLAVGDAGGRLERVACQLDTLPERVAEVDRAKDTAVDLAGVGDAALVEPPRRLRERGARDGERQVVEVADALRVRRGIDRARGGPGWAARR